MRSTAAQKNRARRSEATSTGSRARRCGFWVAMPTGQLLVWQARMPTHPMAWIAALDTAAPRASATLASSDNAPKLMSETKRGIARPSGLFARGPLPVLIGLAVDQLMPFT